MRLINTNTFKFEEFSGDEIPRYAIISHTWGNEEVEYQEYNTNASHHKGGYQKIKSTCNLAASEGYEFVWIDTCCIDKRSSAELFEAINSMCSLYQGSSVCYAYLVDVDANNFDEDFHRARWWTRGWTLQELIAPAHVVFVDQHWQRIGTKEGMHAEISSCTGIKPRALRSLGYARATSIAERMSWASTRSTTRVEDRAYSLLGLFDVNLPLLYGEGMKAFIRLQEEIIKSSSDQSIFAWGLWSNTSFSLSRFADAFPSDDGLVLPMGYAISGPLATSPDLFKNSNGIHSVSQPGESTPFGTTNVGIQIALPIAEILLARNRKGDIEYCAGILACSRPERKRECVGIILQHLRNGSHHARLCGANGAVSTFFFRIEDIMNANMREVTLLKTSG